MNFSVQKSDKIEPVLDEKFPVIIILDHLRSAHNTGNIFRLAEASGIEKIILCGYTPCPPHAKLEKTSRGTEKFVNFEHFQYTTDAIQSLKCQGFKIYGIETVDNAEDFFEFSPQKPAAFIFGNEALGISEDVLELCDAYLKIPMFGRKNSMNVANSAAIVIYKAIQSLQQI